MAGTSSEAVSIEKEKSSSRVINVVFVALLLGPARLHPDPAPVPLHPGPLRTDCGPGVPVLQSVVDWFREAVGIPMERKYNSVLVRGSDRVALLSAAVPVVPADRRRVGPPRTPTAAAAHHGGQGERGQQGAARGNGGQRGAQEAGWPSPTRSGAASRSFSGFLVFRVVGGVCKGNVSVCTAVVADLPCPKARHRGMAMIGVAFSLGFTLGPLMGAYFAVHAGQGEELLHQYPALLALLSAWQTALHLAPAPRGPWPSTSRTLAKHLKVSSPGLEGPRDLLHPGSLFYSRLCPGKRKLQVLGLVYFSYLFLFSGLEFTLSFLTHQRFHFTSMQQGKMFFFIGVIMMSIQVGYSRRIQPGHTSRLSVRQSWP
ncbi:unnamed protein product [Arctogadus glacialis]